MPLYTLFGSFYTLHEILHGFVLENGESKLTLAPWPSRLHCHSMIFSPPSLRLTFIIFPHFITLSLSFLFAFTSASESVLGLFGGLGAGPGSDEGLKL